MTLNDSRHMSSVEILLVAGPGNDASVIHDVLTRMEVGMVEASTAEEACALLEHRRVAAVVTFDISAGYPDSPASPPRIVILSPDAPEAEVLRAYETGAAELLREPVSPTVLQAKVGTFVRLFRASQEAAAHAREAEHARDVTESARRILELNRRRNEFLAMLGHELRNPLAPLNNALQILRQAGTKGPLADQTLDLIDRQFRQLTRLVDDLVDVARITQGRINLQKEEHDLNVALAQAAEAERGIVTERGLTLHVQMAAERLAVFADPARIQQVIANLVRNAVRYTEPGGRITLSTSREDNQAVLRVRDTGIGIRPEMQAAIFELFTQADRAPDRPQEGLGIGLTLVHRLVELHAGSITVTSGGLGQGSEFTVRFPLVGVPPDAGATHHSVHDPAGDAPRYLLPSARLLRILVVEDNRDTARSLANLLRLWGHEVEIAYDGPGALEAGQAFHPEVVLLDIGLPLGMDGYEVALRLRDKLDLGKGVLVALTGFGQPEDRRRAQAAGFDLHLTKPVSADALRKLLAEVGDGRKQEGNAVSH